jgi:hypothetical protein
MHDVPKPTDHPQVPWIRGADRDGSIPKSADSLRITSTQRLTPRPVAPPDASPDAPPATDYNHPRDAQSELQANQDAPRLIVDEKVAVARFGELLTNLVDRYMSEIPNKDRYQAHLFMSRRTYQRCLSGEVLPPAHRVNEMIKAIEAGGDRPVEARERDELRKAFDEARQASSPRARLNAARAEIEKLIEDNRTLESRIDALQQATASATNQLIATAARWYADPDAQEQHLASLRRLVRAQEALRQALQQREENNQEIREYAEELVAALDEYLHD